MIRAGATTTLKGYLNEDLCQALDQLISERWASRATPPTAGARRMTGCMSRRRALRAAARRHLDRERRQYRAMAGKGRCGGPARAANPPPAAARVLERPVDRLWPAG
ncbi:hypothetical protein DdX_21465 [Ditylenchus destructor]|uniref:Uncharacterized protein n=1 Tax=Ditylenchus destructor TaxID=166010 RepID=A0AAD4QV95_9BILA|nr:hypothetical protein DdX_21465 [Ditylenchus destructor]